ncbi:prepilin peptidase [Thalassobacillus pellis]|uniref:prepilin peptidase n=1 Tax=Thalassobacillus pellis TaxID=748008 RepID=UPI0019601950|nr:A24 family peptidase [Thalassobacillus pellis]MBM7554613.1 leader peptidase (prepilin peptidase)/N-methyltransferase [Thalassobacillus pellis]
MEFFYACFLFLYGIICGSFFNVVGRRMPAGESFTYSRSKCPHCSHHLKSSDLIPLLSYVMLLGKCRYCHKPISFLYPSVELLTGIMFAVSFLTFGWSYEFAGALLLITLSMIILVSDLLYMLIPNKLLLFYLPLFILYRIVYPLEPWFGSVFGAVGAAILLAVIIIVSKGGMGAGDMKLMGLLGIMFGFQQALLIFILALFTGAVISLTLLSVRMISRSKPVPFGPYIATGALLTYFKGEELMAWYSFFFH